MKASLVACSGLLSFAPLIAACTQHAPGERPRPVRSVELRYDATGDEHRYFGAVQSRHEIAQAFRVGGKVIERKIDVGQTVREGDVIALLDDVDFRLAEQAARQQLEAATAQARQAESDWRRLQGLKLDGSVSDSDEEHAQSALLTTRAAAEADLQRLELARNQVKYSVLRAPRNGVVTSVQFEVGQVVAVGQPVLSIAAQGEPEIVVDVPEDHLETFKGAHYRALLASAPNETFDVELRELSAQATAQTRTFRARLRPATARPLPLGATATLIVQRTVADSKVAPIPASAITQINGHSAVWVVRPDANAWAVQLVPVTVHGYRNEEVLVSGPPAGERVVTAGVQKMAPGLHVALPGAPAAALAAATR